MPTYWTIGKAASETGYTEHAIRAKIARGDWLEGVVWIRAPDGRIHVSREGYTAWLEGQVCAPQRRRA